MQQENFDPAPKICPKYGPPGSARSRSGAKVGRRQPVAAGFGNWFREQCDLAGLPQCSAHGLRKAGATRAAENGATVHALMPIYDWGSPSQAVPYTRAADRKRLAGESMHLLAKR
jgi:hypothetical protein